MKTSDPRVIHIEPGEGPSLQLFGEAVTRKVAGERTGGAYALFEAVAQAGAEVPLHIHHREDECFYILEGVFVFRIEGRAVTASTGSLVYVPKGALHAHHNVGEGVGRMLVLQTPGGSYEQFYLDVGQVVTSHVKPTFDDGTPDAALITRAAARYGIEIVRAEPMVRAEP